MAVCSSPPFFPSGHYCSSSVRITGLPLPAHTAVILKERVNLGQFCQIGAQGTYLISRIVGIIDYRPFGHGQLLGRHFLIFHGVIIPLQSSPVKVPVALPGKHLLRVQALSPSVPQNMEAPDPVDEIDETAFVQKKVVTFCEALPSGRCRNIMALLSRPVRI
jgi:hypothetical protein